MSASSNSIATNWLNNFAHHLYVGNGEGVAACFLEHGWLRDILICSWNIRSLDGPPKISAYLHDNLKPKSLTNFRVDDRPFLSPEAEKAGPARTMISSGFTFDSPLAHGHGYFKLLQDSTGEWKAFTVLLSMDDLKGHEEIMNREHGMYGAHTLAWGDIWEKRRLTIEEQPHVLIIGAGQNGLNVAARFKQMRIPTLVVERNARIGDNWRQRYPTLTLHTPQSHHPMLYQTFPTNWPLYTPRDKVAQWLEQYAETQDLVIWTNSHPLPTPTYDVSTKKWTVNISRQDQTVTIHPAHIVLATGTLGAPKMPDFKGSDIFKGPISHAAEYQGGKGLAGKRVIVVGAGNTSADVCQDLSFHGAEVTMVQRSTTCVQSVASNQIGLLQAWPENVPTWISDFKFSAVPLFALKNILKEMAPDGWQTQDKDMLDGLRAAGFDVNLGPDGTGVFILVFGRFGGYFVDVGCADLIQSGKVKVKHGVRVDRLTEDGVVFDDGSALPADAVIFATGYHNIREVMKGLFGAETIGKTGEVWGYDEEGEIRGAYRPTGHPALWYAPGDFYCGRFFSKQLALQIKAIELGYMKL